MKTFVENLRYLMAVNDKNAYQIQEETAGDDEKSITQSTTQRILAGKTKNPNQNTIDKYAEYFGIDAHELQYTNMVSDAAFEMNTSKEALLYGKLRHSKSRIIGAGINDHYNHEIELAERKKSQTRLVPVIGNAQMGDHGYWENVGEDGADGYIPVNNASSKAYAMRGKGMSAFPVIRPGWLIAFEPEKELISGEFVHVKLKDGRNMIKEFISKTHDTLSVLSVNGDERLAFSIDEVDFANGFKGIYPPSEWLPFVDVVDLDSNDIDAG